MSTPKRHHYVPEWYLKLFADSETEFLQIYDKQKKEWRKQKPDQVMVINHYYKQDWAPEGVDQNIFEKGMGAKIENEASFAFQRLITEKEKVSEDDIASILIYLDLQKIRTPKEEKKAKKLYKEHITNVAMQIPEVAPALKNNEVEIVIKEQARFDYMRTLVGLHMRYFFSMDWNIVEVAPNCSFITSDNPVTLINYEQPPPLETGIGLAGTSVLFPITPSFLLIMTHRQDKEIHPLTPIPKPELGATRIRIRSSKCLEKNVKTFNYFMYANAQGLVVSDNKNFIKQILE